MQVNERGTQLGELCTALVRRLRFLERSELSCCGIPMSQAMVLQTLAASGRGLRMSAIAEALGVTQSTATRLVEPLVKQTQVNRVPSPDDGRSVLIVLTSKGRQSANELGRQSQRWSDNVLQRIPEDQQEAVMAALNMVVGAVSDCCASGCEPTRSQLQER
jgi:DNA-binding MarR family transcriptional regulator